MEQNSLFSYQGYFVRVSKQTICRGWQKALAVIQTSLFKLAGTVARNRVRKEVFGTS
jgi:hypothetical protein